MKKLRPLVILTLALTLITFSIYGHNPYFQGVENYSSAYAESSNTAHWSIYIPIAILVGAALWCGLADRQSKHSDSSKDSQDGLGSIANSKRISHSRSDSYPPYASDPRPNNHLSTSYRLRKSFCGSHSH